MGEARVPGGTLTFFFSDLEGSTRAAAALGSAFADALEEHRVAVRTALAAGGGREVSTAGDSFFAVFPDAAGALQAAVEIQRAPAPAGLRARIGLHVGQAVVVGSDYVGLDVNRAARIADAGHGGQVLLSETARMAVVDRLATDLSVVDLGRHRLKDIGPERLWELRGEGLPPGPFPPPRSLEAHPTNLPKHGARLVDRERERAELAARIGRSSVVTVTGPGGIGKSRLAIEVATSMVTDFPDGVFHVDLATTPDAATVVGALADVMGFRSAGEEPLLPALLDRLRDRDVLLVLDTADRVAGLPGLVASMAAACPRIRILVSSRSRLRIAAEREYAVGPLPLDAGVELFDSRAREVQPAFQLDAATRPSVERLVARLDGIPLAIELAAARTRLFSPAALLDRLDRRLPALGEGAADAPDRQRTLQAAIAWSCELLPVAEQAAFADLGVFAGPFDVAAVEAVLASAGDTDPLALLEELVDRSLVVAEAGTTNDDGPGHRADGSDHATDELVAGPRFRLLAPIREFAAAALRQSGAEAATRERHARHFLDAVRRDTRTLEGEAELAAIARLSMAEAELRAALDWALGDAADPARAAVGFELAARLGRYWHVRGRVAEGLGRLTRALGLEVDVNADLRARALHWAGVLHDDSGQPEEASRRLEEALVIRREQGDDIEAARILNSLGVVARSMGNLDRAHALIEESLQRKQALGDRRGTAVSLSNLGIVAADQGRAAEAANLMRRALEIDETVGGTAVIISAANLGAALVRAGQHEEGLVQLRRALPGIAELEDPELVIEALVAVAEAALGAAATENGNGSAPGVGAESHAEASDADRIAARLLLAADGLRARERVRLHDADRRHLDGLRATVLAGIDPAVADELQREAGAVDVAAGIALAREATDGLARPD